MLAYTYLEHGKFELIEKPKPVILDDRDAIVKVKDKRVSRRLYVEFLLW